VSAGSSPPKACSISANIFNRARHRTDVITTRKGITPRV
jgi:hypothetical protein